MEFSLHCQFLTARYRALILSLLEMIISGGWRNKHKLLCDDFFCSVSVADLLSHPELDPDSDGSFTEAEAQVTTVFHCVVKTLRGL